MKSFIRSTPGTLFQTIVLVFSACLLLTSCSTGGGNKDLSGRVSISGAFALYPMAVKWAEEFQKIHPSVHIDISAGGAGKGMADALNKMVDLGMVSRDISPEEVAKGAWFIALTKDAVLPVVNSGHPAIDSIKTRGLTKAQFESIFITNKIIGWNDIYPGLKEFQINVYSRSDACGAGEMWAKFLGKKQEDIKGVGVFGDPGMADAVRADPMAIGYNNVIYAYDINSRLPYHGLSVVPIDLNTNGRIDPAENFYQNLDSIMAAIQTGRYPSPPARDLYFVSNGKPQSKVVVEFIRWILNEGQTFVKNAGYVRLTEEKIALELKKLEIIQ
jgi:phosphate transport system substrate-binding protein